MSSQIPLSSMELEVQSEDCQKPSHYLDNFHPSLATIQLFPLDSESSDAKDLFSMQLDTQSEHSQPKS
ncbi:hypothetical protein DPMN_016717 [Dreissena polymorpha]|uniref:Uncharacterized protein n=1 Tax=Dreissena polymorpha TaxID=45954 RepID=A0A9D4NDE5_DREPO|nr:hypothetical protein DPMN_016717 [Dreissena polymorpha]